MKKLGLVFLAIFVSAWSGAAAAVESGKTLPPKGEPRFAREIEGAEKLLPKERALKRVAFETVPPDGKALGPMNPISTVLHCEVIVVAKDLSLNEGQVTFDVPFRADKSHGGDPLEFQFRDHKVSVLADGRWLGLNWSLRDQLLAEGVTVIGNPTEEARVLMLYNPADQDESASINCRK